DVLVGPLEVERVDQGLPHARILELLAAGIDEPALPSRWRFIGQGLELDTPVLCCRKVVARGPDARSELLAKQVVLRGETFERHVAIAIELEAHGVEIEAAAIDRQIGRPPIPDAIELDEAIDLEFTDLVRPGAKRRIQRGLVERAAGVVGLREDR